MMRTKPLVIFDSVYDDKCRHLLVRLDSKLEVKYLLKWFYRFIKKRGNREQLKIDFNDIFKFSDTTFSHARLTEDSIVVDYMFIDEGKKQHITFINFVITAPKAKYKQIRDFKVDDYFEW